MIRVLAMGLMFAGSCAALAQSGVPQFDSATQMRFNGKSITLANIVAPVAGSQCLRGNTRLDCAVLARSGLIDIAIGATVTCKPVTGGHRCTAGGYDLAYGLVHAGWAMPLADASPSYHTKMREARKHRRGLWRFTSGKNGQTAAEALLEKAR